MKLVVANWKMYLGVRESVALAKTLAKNAKVPRGAVTICPSFSALGSVAGVLKKTGYSLGAQDIAVEDRGAYTGEVSGKDLRELGCEVVIIGHSERRHELNETDAEIRKKIMAAIRNRLKPVLCVGETEEERKSGKAEMVVRHQLESALKRLPITHYPLPITVAYEPVWAIGTGRDASKEDVVEMHTFIRTVCKRLLPSSVRVQVLYGGSVDRKNIDSFLAESAVDGVLVGGASARASFAGLLHQLLH
ncbi:MAG: triose-phosphate isomerase [bacterium]|nr:triose-phosphate isomerase [bacterium]